MEEKTPYRKRPRTRSANYSGTPPAELPPGKRGNFSTDDKSSPEGRSSEPLGQAERNKTDDTEQIPPRIDETTDEGPVSLIDLTTATCRPKVQPYSNWNEYLDKTFDDHGTQSTILKEHISEKLSGMLNVLTEVNQRELTRDRRAIPVESPDGTKKTFIPSQQRTKLWRCNPRRYALMTQKCLHSSRNPKKLTNMLRNNELNESKRRGDWK